jgi:hypothetical protein
MQKPALWNLKQRVEANNRTAAPKNPGSGLSSSLVLAVDLYEAEQRVMYEFLSRFNNGELVGLLWTVGPISCALVWIILGHVLEYHRVSVAAALKKAMLERGMSAEEIRIVMEAGEGVDLPSSQDEALGSKNSQRLCKSPAEVEV